MGTGGTRGEVGLTSAECDGSRVREARAGDGGWRDVALCVVIRAVMGLRGWYEFASLRALEVGRRVDGDDRFWNG